MTAAEEAYAKAEAMIAAALADGRHALFLEFEEYHELQALPPQIAELTNLQIFDCTDTKVSDVSLLADFEALVEMRLNGTLVADLSPLSAFAKLKRLRLDGTRVTDLGPLSALTGLTQLWLDQTAVSDLGPLSGLMGLKALQLNDTSVSDLGPLSGLTGLESLALDRTSVSDLGPLSDLTGLTDLWLDETPVSDLRPLRGVSALVENPNNYGLAFKNCAAAQNDARIAEISEIEDDTERARALFEYLEDWVPPGAVGNTKPSPPTLPLEKPAPLRTGFSDGRMVRTTPANLPVEDALERAEKGWDALRAYRTEFGDSFNVHNYAPLPSFLNAFDRAMGDSFDPENLIMIGVMGTRITRLSKNKDFLSCLPTGADTDLQGFGAAIAVYLERFKDWTEYQEDAVQSDVGLGDVIEHDDSYDQMAQSLRDTPEVDVAVSDEYALELAELREPEADDAVAHGFDASNRELLRNLAEKGIAEIKSGRVVRKSVDDMDKMADGEFTKVKFYSYGWTLVILKRNQGPLRRMTTRYPWLGPVLDYLVGEAPMDDDQN